MKPEPGIYQFLRPLGWIYGIFTRTRNRLYDNGRLKSASFGIPVINIGNITVGGTGKTPHTEYTASLIKDRYRTVVLSRGYGRHTKGFIMSDEHSDSGLIGDEPMQIKSRFPDLDMAVCEDRTTGINRIIGLCHPDVVILDDAYQHRKVTPSLNILLVNWHRDILRDAMLPAGRLRESAKGRCRAHIIIVTKCPSDLTPQEMDSMAQRLRVQPQQQVFFTTLDYGRPYLLDDPGQTLTVSQVPVLAVTGIASPCLMIQELERMGHSVTLMNYPDHHRFSKKEIEHISSRLESLGPQAIIMTTAKDAARLKDMNLDPDLRSRIYVLPVGVSFLRDADKYSQAIIEHVESFRKKK